MNLEHMIDKLRDKTVLIEVAVQRFDVAQPQHKNHPEVDEPLETIHDALLVHLYGDLREMVLLGVRVFNRDALFVARVVDQPKFVLYNAPRVELGVVLRLVRLDGRQVRVRLALGAVDGDGGVL